MAHPRTAPRRPTQADVARRAGVSQPVVSYVVAGDAAPVAAETRERVLAAIAELGYVPDRTARNLRRRRTSTIAGIIPDITNPYYPAFQRGVQDIAETHGFDLVTFNTDGDAAKERNALRAAREARVAGVVVTAFHLGLADLEPLAAEGIALVVTGEVDFEPALHGIDRVRIDNVAAAATAVDYLLRRGHRAIGMIAGKVGTPPNHGRVLGYRRALVAHGVEIEPALIAYGEFSVDGGYAAIANLLALPERPTAVFAANDLMAMGAMIRLRQRRLAVPDEMAIVGFDDIPAASLVHPALTTIAHHPARIGRRAAEMVVERLAGLDLPASRHEVLPFDLVLRGTA